MAGGSTRDAVTVPVGARSRSQCRRAFARQRQTVCRTLGLWSPMLAHIVAPVVDAIDFRPSSNGCGDCARGRAQSKRLWESDGATALTVQFAARGSPVTPMLAHMLAPAVDGTDFRASRSGGGSEAAAAHSRRECGRAMARRRGQFAARGSPVTPMLAHMLARPILDFRHC